MPTSFQKRLPSLPIIFISLFIAAIGIGCGGGGAPAPAPTDQDAQGLYTTNGNGSGTFSVTTETLTEITETLTEIKGMVYGDLPNQKFIFFDLATNVLYEGNITSITLKDFVGTATVYHDGVMVDNAVTVSGTVTTRSTISMTLAASGNFAGGSIDGLFINPPSIFDTAATNERSAASIVNVWDSLTDGSVKMVLGGMRTSSFRVNGDDSYSTWIQKPEPLTRCDIEGDLKSGSTKNIYIISTKVFKDVNGTCGLPLTPNYTGFASVVADDGAGKGTEMWYAITDGVNSIFTIVFR